MTAVPPIRSERLDLVPLSARFVDLLLAGRRDEAAGGAGFAVPDGWPDEHDARFLRFRADQLRNEPSRAEWSVRAVVLREPGRPMVGHAGFHGPPGINGLRKAGAVEIGYTIFEPYRRRGFATEAVHALIAWATSERDVHRFIASIAPDNTASLAVVGRLRFVHTGEVWDDEDGRELVFELEA